MKSPTSTSAATLAQRLRDTREAAGLSQSALARAVGIKPQTIQSIEAGKVKRPRHLLEIANALKVSGAWLSGGVGVNEVREPHGVYLLGAPHRTATRASPLTDDALAVARVFMTLDAEQRRALLVMLKALARKSTKGR